MTPRCAQDRLKTDIRRVQERQTNDAFFDLIFDSFGGRLGVVLGAVLGSPKFGEIDPRRSGFRSCDRLVTRWLQDRPKRAPRGVLGSSWGALGPSLESLGGF